MRSPTRYTLRGARVQVFGSLEATLHPREKWDADYFLKNTLKAEVAYSMVAQIQRQIMWFDNTKVVIEGVTIGVMELLEWASELSVGQAGFGAQIRFYGRNFKRYFTPSSSPSRRRGWSSLHQYMVSMIPDFCIGLPQFICDGESESRQLRQWLETWSTSASVDVTLCDGRDNTRDSPPGGCRDSQYSQAYIGKDHMDKTNREPIGRDRHMTLVQSMQCMGSCPTGSQGTQTPQHQQRVPWLRGLQEYPRTHIGQCKRGTQGYFACREVDQAAKCHLPPATTVSAVQQRNTTYTRSPLPTPVAEYRPLQQQPPTVATGRINYTSIAPATASNSSPGQQQHKGGLQQQVQQVQHRRRSVVAALGHARRAGAVHANQNVQGQGGRPQWHGRVFATTADERVQDAQLSQVCFLSAQFRK